MEPETRLILIMEQDKSDIVQQALKLNFVCVQF